MFASTPDGLVLQVRVVARAGRSAVAGVRDDALLVRLAAAPVDGAANAELIAVLAEAFGVPRRAVTLVADTGHGGSAGPRNHAHLQDQAVGRRGEHDSARGERAAAARVAAWVAEVRESRHVQQQAVYVAAGTDRQLLEVDGLESPV